MRKILIFLIPLILLVSIFSISIAAAQSTDCNFWCRLIYLFTGKMPATGGAIVPATGIQDYGSGYGYGYGAVCGNGIVETGEGCDDGNTISGDGCSANCQTETCAEITNENSCTSVGCVWIPGGGYGEGYGGYCQVNVCGDGIIYGTEQCDDGNTASGDGCSATCQSESCAEITNEAICPTIDDCVWVPPSGGECVLYDPYGLSQSICSVGYGQYESDCSSVTPYGCYWDGGCHGYLNCSLITDSAFCDNTQASFCQWSSSGGYCTSCQPTGNDTDCNGIDENCNGVNDDNYIATPTNCGIDLCYNTGTLTCINGALVDTCVPKSPVTVYGDSDSDTYGNLFNTQEVCTLPYGYVFIDEDCNDTAASVNPGANDICDINHNVVNKDCNASNDNELDCTDFCGDKDGDGYVTPQKWGEWGGIIPSIICPWIVSDGDCNDNAAAINPAAAEVCDGVDNNCNGKIDEGCSGADKANALAVLKTLSTSDSKSNKELQDGIKWLTESLGNLNPGGDKRIIWLDSVHIACRHGYKVFDDEKKAVEHLQKVTDPAIKAQVNQVINSIVQADKLLAQTAINEAALTKERLKAIENFNKGESATDLKHKIQYYRKAWKYLNKDCESKGKQTCIDEMTVLSPNGDTVTAIGDEIGTPDTVFTDVYDANIAIHTKCDKCIKAGDVIKGWTIIDIIDDGTLALKCAKK